MSATRGRRELASRASPVPAQPRAAPAQVRHVRVAATDVLRHLVDPALERGDGAGGHERFADAQDQPERLVPELARQEVMDGARRRFLGARGTLVQRRTSPGRRRDEFRLEKFAEQVVEPQHGARLVDHAQEQVAPIELVEHRRPRRRAASRPRRAPASVRRGSSSAARSPAGRRGSRPSTSCARYANSLR